MNTPYGYTKKSNFSFTETEEKIKTELAKEGFGILTEVDVKATLKKKLDVDFDQYVILGACNPPNAYKALLAEKEIGLLLPCNLVVFEENGEVYVSAVRPSVSMKEIKMDVLEEIAYNIESKLKKVLDSVIL